MRYLGIDYGLKRIGLAVSDEEGRIAFPMGVMMNRDIDVVIKEIVQKIKKEYIDRVVVGIPIGLDQRETDQTRLTSIFLTVLKKKVSIEIVTENEMLTSRMAIDAGMRDENIDAASAALILQSYLLQLSLTLA